MGKKRLETRWVGEQTNGPSKEVYMLGLVDTRLYMVKVKNVIKLRIMYRQGDKNMGSCNRKPGQWGMGVGWGEDQQCDHRSRRWNLKVEGRLPKPGNAGSHQEPKRQLDFSPRASADNSTLDLRDLLTF